MRNAKTNSHQTWDQNTKVHTLFKNHSNLAQNIVLKPLKPLTHEPTDLLGNCGRKSKITTLK